MEAKPRGRLANVRRVSVYSSRRGSSAGSSNSTTSGAPEDSYSSASGAGAGSGTTPTPAPASSSTTTGKYDTDDGHVRVAVRCRPMSARELDQGHESIVDFEGPTRIVVHDVSEQPGDQLGTKSAERRNVSHVYDFDQVFDCRSRQDEVYDSAVRPLVDQVLLGYNCTVFAYGQTGTGKTYTMEGASTRLGGSGGGLKSSDRRRRGSRPASGSGKQRAPAVESSTSRAHDDAQGRPVREGAGADPSGDGDGGEEHGEPGIIPRTFEQIFEHVARSPEIRFLIRASYLEIYQEEIRDLLKKDARARLELHERADIGVYVKDLTSFVCKSISEIERVMRVGNQNRIVGATDMNEHSSRSHAIFTITIEQQPMQQPIQQSVQQQQSDAGAPGATASGKLASIRVGKLNLVDLAGSERQRKTNSSGQRQTEAIKINLSLSALGNVINSLTRLKRHEQRQQQQQQQQQQHEAGQEQQAAAAAAARGPAVHTPYRDSKLTRLLQDSLGGNAKTLMIAHIGPASYNYDETINTLNYASRARCIRNRPRVNEDPKDALLRELQREIDLLRAQLAAQQASAGVNGGNGATDDKATLGAERNASANAPSPCGSQPQPPPALPVQGTGASRDQRERVAREFAELKQKLASVESKILNNCGVDLQAGAAAAAAATAASAGVGVQSHQAQTKQQQQQQQQQVAPTNRALDHQALLKDLTREQELELDRRQEELARQASRARAIRDELERREEAEMLAKQSFESVQQEVEAKRRLVWKVLLRAKELRDEICAVQEANRLELSELDQIQAALQRELKLKALIMDNFVPNFHVDELVARIAYNDRRQVCHLEPLELPGLALDGPGSGPQEQEHREQSRQQKPQHRTPSCLVGARNSAGALADYWRPTLGESIRPKSEMERISEAIYPSNIRYKYEELIEPWLDEGPLMAPPLPPPPLRPNAVKSAGGRPSAEARARR